MKPFRKIAALLFVTTSLLLSACSSDPTIDFYKKVLKKNKDNLLTTSEWYQYNLQINKKDFVFNCNAYMSFDCDDTGEKTKEYSYSSKWVFTNFILFFEEFTNVYGTVTVERQGYKDGQNGLVDIKRTTAVSNDNTYEYSYSEMKVYKNPSLIALYNINQVDLCFQITQVMKNAINKKNDKNLLSFTVDVEAKTLTRGGVITHFDENYIFCGTECKDEQETYNYCLNATFLPIQEKKSAPITITEFDKSFLFEERQTLTIPTFSTFVELEDVDKTQFVK